MQEDRDDGLEWWQWGQKMMAQQDLGEDWAGEEWGLRMTRWLAAFPRRFVLSRVKVLAVPSRVMKVLAIHASRPLPGAACPCISGGLAPIQTGSPYRLQSGRSFS